MSVLPTLYLPCSREYRVSRRHLVTGYNALHKTSHFRTRCPACLSYACFCSIATLTPCQDPIKSSLGKRHSSFRPSGHCLPPYRSHTSIPATARWSETHPDLQRWWPWVSILWPDCWPRFLSPGSVSIARVDLVRKLGCGLGCWGMSGA